MSNQPYFEQNENLWNNRVEAHLQSKLYDMPGFLSGKSSLTEIEADALGDVQGKRLLHLQCHFGQDTLSWARKGAMVTGVDFSIKAIETAEQLATDLRLPARFIHSNVYDLPGVLKEGFDIVFTTFGAIPWLPDLEAWAKMIGRFLNKGGTFYLAEFHPTFYLFNFENFQIEYHYFNKGTPYEELVEGTYADRTAKIQDKEYFWNHSLEDIIMPLTESGLLLEEFREYGFSPYNCFPNMKEKEPGRFVWEVNGVQLPHVFSLKMRKG